MISLILSLTAAIVCTKLIVKVLVDVNLLEIVRIKEQINMLLLVVFV